jgi:phage-related protein
MGNEIDSRVVQMQFDNSRFEQNVRQSMNTLSQMNRQLELTGANKGLDEISAKASKIDFSNISSSVDSLASRFSTFGIVGMTAIQNITNSVLNLGKNLVSNVFNKIKEGGLNRALNIEQAKFQIEGLNHSWDELKEQINYGVKDTAYGLDSAAKAAAQLLASGVSFSKKFDSKNPDKMARTLRAISGVAAMTNSTYDDMSRIFITVAGNGRLMTEQLLQFSGRGLNVAATLRDYFNKSSERIDEFYKKYTSTAKKSNEAIKKGDKATEENIRTMITNSAIDFETFSKAMDEFYGEHAKEANKTYTGALANVGAALSRLGAKFQDIRLKDFRDVFNSLIPVIDTVSSLLDPFVAKVDKVAGRITKLVTFSLDYINNTKLLNNTDYKPDGLFGNFDDYKTIIDNVTSSVSSLINIFKNVISVIKPTTGETTKWFYGLKKGLVDVTGSVSSFLKKIDYKTIDYFNENIKKYAETFKNFRAVLGNVGSSIVNILKAIFKGLSPTSAESFSFFDKLASSLSRVSNFLYLISKRMKNFFGDEERLNSIKNIFNGIREAVLLVKDVFVGLISIFKPGYSDVTTFAEGIGEVLDKVIRFGGEIGRFIHDLREYLKTSEAMTKFFTKLKETVSTAASPIIAFIGGIKDALSKLFSSESDGSSENQFDFLEKAAEKAATALDRIKAALEKLKDFVKGVFDKIKDTVRNAIGSINPMKALSIGMLLASFRKLFKTVQSGYWTVKKIKWGLTNNIVKFFDSLKGALINFNKEVKEKRLREIAVSIALLAGSLLILSSIKPEAMQSGIEAITVLIGELILAFQALNVLDTGKFGGSGNLTHLGLMASVMLKAAGAVLILAEAVKMIGKLEPEQATQGVVAIGGLLLLLIGFMDRIQKSNLDKEIPSLISLSFAMLILAEVVRMIGKLNPEQAIQGVVAIGFLLGEIFAFMKGLSDQKIDKELPALIGLSIALGILAIVVKIIGSMPLEQAVQGVVAIGFLLVEIFAFMKGLNDQSIDKALPNLLGLSVAMAILAVAVKIIGSMPLEQAAQGVIALGIIMAEIYGLMYFMEKLKKVGENSKSLLIISASLFVLAETIKVLGGLSLESIAKGLITLAVGLGIILGAAALAEKVTVGLAALSGALVGLGIACLAVGAGIFLFAAGLTALVALGGSGIAIIIAGVLALINVIPLLMQALGSGFVKMISSFIDSLISIKDEIFGKLAELLLGMLDMILEYMPQFIDKGGQIIIAFLKGISSKIGDITSAAIEVVVEFLNGIADQADDLVEAGLNVIIAVLDGIAEKIDDLIVAGTNVIISFLDGVGQSMQDVIDAGWDLIINLINGITDSINTNIGTLRAAIGRLADAIIDALIDPLDILPNNLFTTGVNCLEGLLNGLRDKKTRNNIKSEAERIGGAVIKGVNKVPKVSSPSKETFNTGRFIGMGLVNGIKSYFGKVDKVSGKMGEISVDAMRDAISRVSDIIDSDVSLSPTITPVLNLDDVQAGARTIGSMLNGQTVGISANVGVINNMMSRRQSATSTSDIVNAVNRLRQSIEDNPKTVNHIGGVTYDDGSNVSTAVEDLIHALKVERRV